MVNYWILIKNSYVFVFNSYTIFFLAGIIAIENFFFIFKINLHKLLLVYQLIKYGNQKKIFFYKDITLKKNFI